MLHSKQWHYSLHRDFQNCYSTRRSPTGFFISEMLHSKQWHYSLHRDFQNCYSTRRSPTGFFSSNSSSNSTRVPIHPHTTYKLHTRVHMHPENSPSRIQFYMQKTKELFEYYYIQRAKRPSFQKRNSTHRRQGDLLEIHPCVLQDLPRTFQTFQTFQSSQSFQTFQSFQTLQRHSGHSSHS